MGMGPLFVSVEGVSWLWGWAYCLFLLRVSASYGDGPTVCFCCGRQLAMGMGLLFVSVEGVS